MLPIRVISLQRHTRRRDEFRRRNAHLAFEFFDGVDGRTLTMDGIRATGAFTSGVEATYDAHGYGAALSHWHLWKEAASGTGPLTIAEDDVVFRGDFEAKASALLGSLPPDWDLVLWGWNFDTVLQVQPMAGVSPVVMLFDQQQLRGGLDEFAAMESNVHPMPLHMAFGLPAYTLSPRGAGNMLQRCFPQRPLSVLIPAYKHRVANVGVDVAAAAAYPSTQSFACFPPLAVTPNRRGEAPA